MNTQDCRKEIQQRSAEKCPTYPAYCKIQFEHAGRKCHDKMRRYYQTGKGSYVCPECEEIVTGAYRDFYYGHFSHLREFKPLKCSILRRIKTRAAKLAKAADMEKSAEQETERSVGIEMFKAPISRAKRVERGSGTADRGLFLDKMPSPHPCVSRKRQGDVKVFPIFEKKSKNLERTLQSKKVVGSDGFSLDGVIEDDGVQDAGIKESAVKDSVMKDVCPDEVEDPAETRTAVNVIEDLMAEMQKAASFKFSPTGIDVDAHNYASSCAPLVKKQYVAPVKTSNCIAHTPILISDSEVSPTYDSENADENDSYLEGSVVDSKDYNRDDQEDEKDNEKEDEKEYEKEDEKENENEDEEGDEKGDENEDAKENENEDEKGDEKGDEKEDERDDNEKGDEGGEMSNKDLKVPKVTSLDCYDSMAVLIANVLGQEKSLTAPGVRQNLKEAFTGDERQSQDMQKVIVKALDDVILVKEMELKGIKNLRAAACLIGKVMRDRRATENLVTENMKALFDILYK